MSRFMRTFILLVIILSFMVLGQYFDSKDLVDQPLEIQK